MASLDKSMMEAIDNYGDRIITMEDFIAGVRQTPGMYLGPIGNKGFLNMIREIFQNSIDQMIDNTSPCDWFHLFYDERNNEIVVEDNGLGFPFKDIIRILTSPHTSKNFNKEKGQYSSGLNGVGAKVVNALSETFEAESYHYSGKAVKIKFKKGHPTTKEPVSIPNKKCIQGSKVKFNPDLSILGDLSLEWREVYTLLKKIMSLTPIGCHMDFEAIDIKGNRFTETIINKDGIITDLIMKSKHPIIKPIVIRNDDGIHKLECAFCFDSGDPDNGPDSEENVTAFCNFCPTVKGSTHVSGTIDGIARWFSQYMNNIYLSNQKSKIKVKDMDIKTGLNVMIAAAHIKPLFTGQAKEILSNEDMYGFCKETVMRGLDDWSKANPQDLAKMSRFFKDIAELRQKSEQSKAKIATKYKSNPLTKMPDKYITPITKKTKDIELFIVEGDSAKGSAEIGRDKYTQGIFPIRGKIINAFKCSKEKFFSNEEVQGITRIMLGTDYRRNFTIEELKVGKVIIMSDGDVDGAHIAALLLRMFIMYFPQIIEAGMLYKAIPPLYSIPQGKKTKYFTDQIDIIRYTQKSFSSKYSLATLKKQPIQGKDLTVFFMKNKDYIHYLVDVVSSIYLVEPYLLEMILYHYIINGNKINVSKLDKEVRSVYRFMSVDKKGKVPVISGMIGKSNLIICHEKFFNDCKPILDIIRDNDSLYYLLDGEKKSLYQIMSLYKEPSDVQRYKGLGEMDADQLADSTMDVNNRTLIRYTLTDAKEEIEAIREYETDSKKILTLVGNVSREDLLD